MKTEIRTHKTFIGYYYGEVLIFNDDGKVNGYIHTPDYDTEKEAHTAAYKITKEMTDVMYCACGEYADGTEFEMYYWLLDDARSYAGSVIECGGLAHVTDDNGDEYPIF